MARASTPTLLSLDRFAEILGMNPAHFNQAASVDVMPVLKNCPDVFFQQAWQDVDTVARDDIARTIDTVEEEMAEVLGFYPAPKFIEKEIHQFPRHYRPDIGHGHGINIRGQRVAVRTHFGKIIQAGRRTVSAVELGAVIVFSDEDGDSYDETATITVATTLTDVNEVKVYFVDENGDPDWEVRHPRTKTIVGGVFIATYFSWQLIQPALWDALTPTLGKLSVLKLTDSIYETNVDVYREFPDFTEPSAQFFFENHPRNQIFPSLFSCPVCDGTGCGACELRVQDGCLFPRNVDGGFATPVPATFDTTTGQWVEQVFIDCRAADQVKLWYLAGDIDQRFLKGLTNDPLKLYWAEAITWMTVARLPRPLCNCGRVEKLVEWLRTDLADTQPDGVGHTLSENNLDNPFGTRRGEVKAWRRVGDLSRKRSKVAVI